MRCRIDGEQGRAENGGDGRIAGGAVGSQGTTSYAWRTALASSVFAAASALASSASAWYACRQRGKQCRAVISGHICCWIVRRCGRGASVPERRGAGV